MDRDHSEGPGFPIAPKVRGMRRAGSTEAHTSPWPASSVCSTWGEHFSALEASLVYLGKFSIGPDQVQVTG